MRTKSQILKRIEKGFSTPRTGLQIIQIELLLDIRQMLSGIAKHYTVGKLREETIKIYEEVAE